MSDQILTILTVSESDNLIICKLFSAAEPNEIVLGDIEGNEDGLNEFLEYVERNSNLKRVIFLGDYRYLDNYDDLKHLIAFSARLDRLANNKEVIYVLGNKEKNIQYAIKQNKQFKSILNPDFVDNEMDLNMDLNQFLTEKASAEKNHQILTEKASASIDFINTLLPETKKILKSISLITLKGYDRFLKDTDIITDGLYFCSCYSEKNRIYSHMPLYTFGDVEAWPDFDNNGRLITEINYKNYFYYKGRKKDIPIVKIPNNIKWSINICGHIKFSEAWKYSIRNKNFIVLDNTQNVYKERTFNSIDKNLRALLIVNKSKKNSKNNPKKDERLLTKNRYEDLINSNE